MKEGNKEDNWLCYVAVPDYTKQNHLICIGTSASCVYESALKKGYRRPVIYSTPFYMIKNSLKSGKEKNPIKIDSFLLPQIPKKVLEELLEK